MNSSKAVYAGSFDPLTNGHLDIIKRGLDIFDEVVVATANNTKKKNLFSPEERISTIQDVLKSEGLEAKVTSFEGLLVDYCQKIDAGVIIRGLRAVSDYEYESKLAMMNRQLDEAIETVFLMTSKDCSFISSHIVKEVAAFGGDVSSTPLQACFEYSKRGDQ